MIKPKVDNMINQTRFFSLLLILLFNSTIIVAQITKPLDLNDFGKFKVESLNLYQPVSDNILDQRELISMNTGSFTPFSLSVNNTKNDWFRTPAASKKTSIFTIPASANYQTTLNKNAYQNTRYEGKERIWKPHAGVIAFGSALSLIGYSALFIPPSPFPDLDDKKFGTQALFTAGAVSAIFGTFSTLYGIFYHPQIYHSKAFPYPPSNLMRLLPTAENDSVKASVTEILNQGQIKVHDMTNGLKGIPKNATAFDDRFEFMINNQKSVIYFNNLYATGTTGFVGFKKIFVIENTKFKLINNNHSLFDNLKNGFIQIRTQLFNELKAQEYEKQLDAFKPLAAKYRRLSEPPTMSEEQRRYIVLANTSLEEKNFKNAITFFNNAISVDPITYPTAYFNLALALALTDNYDDAILNMKKYLLLIPDSTEARDKIYEWELKIQK